MTDITTPDIDAVDALADELLRALTPHAGDAEAVNRTLMAYFDSLEWTTFAYVCMSAVRETFAACLTMTDPAAVPPGALALVPPIEGAGAA